MKLADLNPGWVSAGGAGVTFDGQLVPERHGVGVAFDCPCGCSIRCYIGLENPLDGGPPRANEGEPLWHREGDTFDVLTLSPSILRSPEKGGCGWHGFVTRGEVSDVLAPPGGPVIGRSSGGT